MRVDMDTTRQDVWCVVPGRSSATISLNQSGLRKVLAKASAGDSRAAQVCTQLSAGCQEARLEKQQQSVAAAEARIFQRFRRFAFWS